VPERFFITGGEKKGAEERGRPAEGEGGRRGSTKKKEAPYQGTKGGFVSLTVDDRRGVEHRVGQNNLNGQPKGKERTTTEISSG